MPFHWTTRLFHAIVLHLGGPKTCSQCRFAVLQRGWYSNGETYEFLECRRYAPRPGSGDWEWRVVKKTTAACGDFRHK